LPFSQHSYAYHIKPFSQYNGCRKYRACDLTSSGGFPFHARYPDWIFRPVVDYRLDFTINQSCQTPLWVLHRATSAGCAGTTSWAESGHCLPIPSGLSFLAASLCYVHNLQIKEGWRGTASADFKERLGLYNTARNNFQAKIPFKP
jgi:hypothetical protein